MTNTEAAEAEKLREEFQQKFLKMPPILAGQIIVKAVEKDAARVLVGNDAKFGSLIERLAPVAYWKFLGPRMS